MIIRTKKLEAVFKFIVAYKSAHDGNSPTMREIGTACRISSTSLVNYYLDRLEKTGRIQMEPGMSRMISVAGGNWRFNHEPVNIS